MAVRPHDLGFAVWFTDEPVKKVFLEAAVIFFNHAQKAEFGQLVCKVCVFKPVCYRNYARVFALLKKDLAGGKEGLGIVVVFADVIAGLGAFNYVADF